MSLLTKALGCIGVLIVFTVGCESDIDSDNEKADKTCQKQLDTFFVCSESEIKKDCSTLKREKTETDFKDDFLSSIEKACDSDKLWKVCNPHNPPYKVKFYKRYNEQKEKAYKACEL